MELITDFPIFLISVVLISLSGVMTPGPLFAVTLTKGLGNKNAGVLVSIGHGIIEFPLMLLIYFGFAHFLALDIIQRVIGLVGGMLMIYIGFRVVKSRKRKNSDYFVSGRGSLIAGIATTAANPYFLLWWATIGTVLVLNASIFGLTGFLIFAIVHWLCDLLWNTFISRTIFKSKRFLNDKVYNIIFIFCFAILVGFGAWFIISALYKF